MNDSTQNTSQTTSDRRTRTALVLGGGGSAGNAWLLGVVAGLVEGGLDVANADLIVGTSAGSTAAAQITGSAPADLLAAILAAPQPESAPVGSDRRSVAMRGNAHHIERLSALIATSEDAAHMRRRMGAAALETDAASDPAAQAQWRSTVAARLPSQSWPGQRMLITAVDAETGEPVVFDRDSGVTLVDAVAASCASGFAYRIGDTRYIDGGYRANAENADLAAGYERILVLSPFSGRSLQPRDWGLDLATQLDELRACGSRIHTIFPSGPASEIFAIGGNVMDQWTRRPAARSGYQQASALAAGLAEFWR